jgi:hypothetical protein
MKVRRNSRDDIVQIEMTKEEAAALALVIRMGGYHRRKEYPEHLRVTENPIVKLMSKLLKRLEKVSK